MKKILTILVLALLTLPLHAAITAGHPAYDPFADASGSSGTTYTVGALLIGQTNAQGLTWAGAGTSNNFQPKINSGNLSVPGLAASTGNSVSYGFASANTGDTGRLGLGGAITSGTVYYSLALEVGGLGALDPTGAIVAAFNNSTGSGGQPTVLATRLYMRLSGTANYNFGMDKNTAGTQWDTALHNVGETVFVVGSYTFNTNSTMDDTSSLWINPDPSTFGAATAPTPLLTTSAGNDITGGQVASFLLRQGSTVEPNMIADDVRVGLTWADVTPPANVTPVITSITETGGTVTVNFTGSSSDAPSAFTLVGSGTVIPFSAYAPVAGAVITQVSPGVFQATVATSGSSQFYKIKR